MLHFRSVSILTGNNAEQPRALRRIIWTYCKSKATGEHNKRFLGAFYCRFNGVLTDHRLGLKTNIARHVIDREIALEEDDPKDVSDIYLEHPGLL